MQKFKNSRRPAQVRTVKQVLVGPLMPLIKKRLHDDWSYQDLCQVLADMGLNITPSTLRHYVSEHEATAKPASAPSPKTSNMTQHPAADVQIKPSIEQSHSETKDPSTVREDPRDAITRTPRRLILDDEL